MASNPTGRTGGEYSENSIRVLKGLEPVRQRPGMYTRTDNPLHVIQEVLDNSADEALAGHGKKIRVTLHADASISIEDDGRGIPFGLHPEENAPVLELVFTRLHAGGKFDKGKGGAYSFSGGLHGVGVSVTNALAKRLEVTSCRDGKVAYMVFAGGDVIEPLQLRPAGDGERKRHLGAGLARRQVFRDQHDSHARVAAPAAQQGRADARRHGEPDDRENARNPDLAVQGGLRDYLTQALSGDPVIPLFEGESYADSSTTVLPKARARNGASRSPKTATRCARVMST
jgi:topoisomerase-4 subunit B